MEYIILALATWRLASLLATEEGPYLVFERLRRKLGVYYDEHSNAVGSNELARALICIWCSSLWIGAGWALAYFIAGSAAVWLALPLALSAGAILFDESTLNS